MKIRTGQSILILFLSLLLLVSCTKMTQAPEKEIDTEQTALNVENGVSENTEITEEPEVEEEEEFIPEESQQISEFPWDDDEEFRRAQMENDTDVLIAGFVTVSEDYSDDEKENIRLAASMISGTVLQPGEVFSQNETAGPYTEDRGYLEGENYVGGQVVKDFGGGVCNVATTLYNTSIAADVEIVERHNHSMPVPYVPYGQDAAVAYGYKDFKFKNNTDHPLLIWTELVDNRLYMAFYGKEPGPEIKWIHETVSETEATTVYKTNPELDEGVENILVKGLDGKVVDTMLEVKYPDGEVELRDLGRSAYNPLNTLIETGE